MHSDPQSDDAQSELLWIAITSGSYYAGIWECVHQTRDPRSESWEKSLAADMRRDMRFLFKDLSRSRVSRTFYETNAESQRLQEPNSEWSGQQ